MDRVHVVLDPGHGGFEPGAVTSDGIAEADLNYEVAVRAEELLEARGFEVLRYGISPPPESEPDVEYVWRP